MNIWKAWMLKLECFDLEKRRLSLLVFYFTLTKCGSTGLFRVLRRINPNFSMETVLQEICKEFSTEMDTSWLVFVQPKGVIWCWRLFMEVPLREMCQILCDLQYRLKLYIYVGVCIPLLWLKLFSSFYIHTHTHPLTHTPTHTRKKRGKKQLTDLIFFLTLRQTNIFFLRPNLDVKCFSPWGIVTIGHASLAKYRASIGLYLYLHPSLALTLR